MARKKKEPQPELNTEILIGFVNSFSFNDPKSEEALGGHPKPGRVYQVIKDNYYGYRVHVGAENNPSGMSGVLLGSELVGDHDGKWVFDISLLTKENFLNFNVHEEDTEKLLNWFQTDNKQLRETLEQPVHIVAADEDGKFVDPFEANKELSQMVAEFEATELSDDRYNQFVESINTIKEKDIDFFDRMCDVINYFASTYSDKYEATSRGTMAKNFMLFSDSPDVAIFNSFKYLQRYCTTGFEKSRNTKDLYKAVHYILFELQRNHKNGK